MLVHLFMTSGLLKQLANHVDTHQFAYPLLPDTRQDKYAAGHYVKLTQRIKRCGKSCLFMFTEFKLQLAAPCSQKQRW